MAAQHGIDDVCGDRPWNDYQLPPGDGLLQRL